MGDDCSVNVVDSGRDRLARSCGAAVVGLFAAVDVGVENNDVDDDALHDAHDDAVIPSQVYYVLVEL